MSLVTAFKSAVKGEYVTDKVYMERLALCRGCNNLRGGVTCSKCFCFVKAKAWIPQESCPVNKWGEAEPADKPELIADEAIDNGESEFGEIVFFVSPQVETEAKLITREPEPDNSLLGKIKRVFKKKK